MAGCLGVIGKKVITISVFFVIVNCANLPEYSHSSLLVPGDVLRQDFPGTTSGKPAVSQPAKI